MRKTLIIARRELAAYFVSPMAYVIGGLFLLASALWFFHSIFIAGRQASLRPLFEAMAYILTFALPLLTMRLVADEVHTGTVETLMTAPITEAHVIVGKFLGVMGFYLALLATTLVLLVLMAIYGQPDTGVVTMGYLGMVLVGALFASVGLFTSAMTSYQLVAAIVAAGICAAMVLLPQAVIATGLAPWDRLASRLSVMMYVKDTARGVFDTRGVIFFVTTSAVFLYLSIKTMESRRWR